MDEPIPRRAKIAFLISPLATVLALGLLGFVYSVATGESLGRALGAAGHATFFFAFFGLPIAYVAAFPVGVPSYHLLRARGKLRPRNVLLIGAATGALVMPAVWLLFFGGSLELTAVGIGALAGGCAAAVFVMIGLRPAAQIATH